MSKYDSIRTAAEMVQEVRMHGLSTAQEDLNRVADIFGRSNVEELVRLANDIRGRSTPSSATSGAGKKSPASGTCTPIPSMRSSWRCGKSVTS